MRSANSLGISASIRQLSIIRKERISSPLSIRSPSFTKICDTVPSRTAKSPVVPVWSRAFARRSSAFFSCSSAARIATGFGTPALCPLPAVSAFFSCSYAAMASFLFAALTAPISYSSFMRSMRTRAVSTASVDAWIFCVSTAPYRICSMFFCASSTFFFRCSSSSSENTFCTVTRSVPRTIDAPSSVCIS